MLAVTDSPELNAYACGGHVVAVSTGALELLPDDELASSLTSSAITSASTPWR